MKRPYEVTVIGVLLILTGVAAAAYHFVKLTPRHAFEGANLWIFLVEFVVIVVGAFILRGDNWARWLAMAWMGFHVGISFLDSWNEVAVHSVFFVVIAWALFRRESREYFRRDRTAAA